ncbi:MAG: CocE/NonD family hydrolase [Flavisolibacter sp.]
MRDGIKLYTVIFMPVNAKIAVPFLLTRTPYNASFRFPDNTVVALSKNNFTYLRSANRGLHFYVSGHSWQVQK